MIDRKIYLVVIVLASGHTSSMNISFMMYVLHPCNAPVIVLLVHLELHIQELCCHLQS